MSVLGMSILSPDEGERYLAGPFDIRARVLGAQSAGAFELYELTLGRATVDYHVHHNTDETICVVEGEIEFILDGEVLVRPAGSVAFVPRGVFHGFSNRSDARARVMIQFTPATDQHIYFRELAHLFAAPTLDTAALAALQQRFDQALVALPTA